jgi:hypothetical protein
MSSIGDFVRGSSLIAHVTGFSNRWMSYMSAAAKNTVKA